ncbi:MAG: hypothetical protein COA67_12195 [Lutibacter sp.]|nr:MAG: hypothetical protein COA67_12195 [Lutibacter sp.]
MIKLKRIVFLLLITLFFSCNSVDELQIKTGDIVFRGMTKSELSQAINDVTQTEIKTNYTHMGVCEVVGEKVFVYHADLGKGVVKESLNDFLASESDSEYVADLYRINKDGMVNFKSIIKEANDLIGNEYNTTYILEDDGYYCSEYVYELFKKDSVFELEPMTFKDPKTNNFHKGWIEHYQKLGIDIPEGKLGCNPNVMASSETIRFVKNIQ